MAHRQRPGPQCRLERPICRLQHGTRMSLSKLRYQLGQGRSDKPGFPSDLGKMV